MRTASVFAIMVTILLVFFSGRYVAADGSKAGEKQGEVTKIELMISNDGRAIVDQNGNEIARFVEGMRVQTVTKEKGQKLQGCMRCWYECLIYEGERCVRWIRTCQWDFDCK